MKQCQLSARDQYELSFRIRRLRPRIGLEAFEQIINAEIWVDAFTSIINRRSRFTGWRMSYRMQIFYSLQCERYPELGGIPF